jgi:hypothetical protein
MATFNGHKNWNHWNVALWIANDEAIYNTAKALVSCGGPLDDAARMLVSALPSHTPDGAPYSFTAVRAALRGL